MSQKSYVQRAFNPSELLTAMYLGKPYSPKANSLLNTLWGVYPDERPQENEYPRLGLFGVGGGAHQLVSKESGGSSPMSTPIYATDNGMNNPLPLVVRELTNDLTPIERQRFAMREVREIDGVMYAIYWLRWINLDNVQQVSELEIVEDGEVISRKPYNPAPESLEPPLRSYDDESLSTSRQRITTYFQIPVTFDAADTAEFVNACTVMTGDPTTAVISEIILASAVPRELPIQSATGNEVMREAICAQQNAHCSTYHVLYATSTGFNMDIKTGAGEPVTVPESVG